MQEQRIDLSSDFHAAMAGPFVREEPARGVVLMRGRDARDLLHRLSTTRLDNLHDGEVRETLLTTEKGRVIDAILVARDNDLLRLYTSPGRAADVRTWLEKFTIMEDCTYEDASDVNAQFSIHNIPDAGNPLPGLALPASGSVTTTSVGDVEVEILRHESVTGPGLRLVCATPDAAVLRAVLLGTMKLPLLDDEAFALWRVARLLPAVGYELGERTNPLEAGAARAVDFRKGCFIGQEVIARLDSYDKVQRHPRRLRFAAGTEAPALGSDLVKDGADAGFVTTVAVDPETRNVVGIGLVRNAFARSGTMLSCGGALVEVRDGADDNQE
ncbi:MAG: hypothetical protein RBU27_11275 [Bacteroidota bacterium]|nr:hypothetical protein [Bacteroidota bacterium]